MPGVTPPNGRVGGRRGARASRSSSGCAAWCRASAFGPSSTTWPAVTASSAGCATRRPACRSMPKARRPRWRRSWRRCRGRRRHARSSPRWRRRRREPAGDASFVILESAADPDAYQLVSPDIALCPDCRAELLDRARPALPLPVHQLHQLRAALHHHRVAALRPRAHHHAALPAVPRSAAREYEDPTDRRFHAEPNACPVCGPRVWLVERGADAPGAAELSARGGRRGPQAPAAISPAAGPPDAAIAGRPSCCAPATSSPSRASAASTSPATPPTARPCASSSAARAGRTSRWR